MASDVAWIWRLCCRLNLHHRYELRYTDDNETFEQCTRCRKVFYRHRTTGFGMG